VLGPSFAPVIMGIEQMGGGMDGMQAGYGSAAAGPGTPMMGPGQTSPQTMAADPAAAGPAMQPEMSGGAPQTIRTMQPPMPQVGPAAATPTPQHRPVGGMQAVHA
jgi:hypothetical protein